MNLKSQSDILSTYGTNKKQLSTSFLSNHLFIKEKEKISSSNQYPFNGNKQERFMDKNYAIQKKLQGNMKHYLKNEEIQILLKKPAKLKNPDTSIIKEKLHQSKASYRTLIPGLNSTPKHKPLKNYNTNTYQDRYKKYRDSGNGSIKNLLNTTTLEKPIFKKRMPLK